MSWVENLTAGVNAALKKSYDKVVVDEIETMRVLERERMEREREQEERKLAAFHRYYTGKELK